MNRSEAEEHLRVIRALMEKATIYRAISAPTALVGGLLSVATAAWLHWGNAEMKEWRPLFLASWLTVLAAAGAANSYFVWRDAQRRQEPFVSAGMRKALLALLPPFVCAGVLTAAVVVASQPYEALPFIWIIFYGLGLLATGQFAPRSIPRLGGAFLSVGLVAVLMAATGIGTGLDGWMRQPNLVMGTTFGGLHLLYALCTWWKADEG